MDWGYAVLFLLVGTLHVAAALLRPEYDRLLRVSLVFFGLTTISALLMMLSNDVEFVPWGFAAVLCLVIGVAAGVGSRINSLVEPGR